MGDRGAIDPPAAAREISVMSTRVAVLPSHVADQIAAGEVVERPASVVKELVENAIDAGARSIDVTVVDGGRALIRISDDGHGMGREDAVLAVSRHATSKIRQAHDLVGVTTFGFRGEALPAIGSVSELTIETAEADGDATLVRVAHGHLVDVLPATRRRGTTVEVAGLFAQVPARRKFLRAARTEWRAIHEQLATVALVQPGLRLAASHDGKSLLALAPAGSLRERVGQLWGDDLARGLVPVDDVRGPIRVHGVIEKPSDVGLGTRRTVLVVNGRVVRDPGIVRAAEAAYKTTISSGVRPSLVLAIDLPGDDVDVNVHPAKAEVRFRDRWTLEGVVEGAVRRALGTSDSVSGVRVWTPAVATAPAVVDVELLRAPPPRAPLWSAAPLLADGPPDGDAPSLAVPPFATDRPAPAATDDADAPIVIPPLIQLRRTWIMAERGDGVLLIDQHAAHERILYERFMTALASGEGAAQRLLLPLTLHLSPAEADAVEVHREWLERLGFEIEGFGGDSLLVSAVPLPHPRFDAARCLRETIAQLAGDRDASAHARHERLAATVACKAAIKAGDALALPEMRALYADLARTTLAPHDVHGRSTIVVLTWDELERRFGRQ
jgi:DNA mismatch repair protein MutL